VYLVGDRSVPVYFLQYFCRQAVESGQCPLFFMPVDRKGGIVCQVEKTVDHIEIKELNCFSGKYRLAG